MATHADAEAGWCLFRDRHGAISRDEINHLLEQGGHKPISERTYRHYEKLRRYGHSSYLPINQLDVQVANERRE